MPGMEAELRPPKELHEVYSKLRELGDRELRKRLTRAIREATKPAKEAVKANELAKFPRRGGFAARMAAKTRLTNKVGTSRKNPGVTITIANDYDVSAINRGRLRHRVYGKGWAKKTQVIPAGVLTDPLVELRPKVAEQITHELQQVARELGN